MVSIVACVLCDNYMNLCVVDMVLSVMPRLQLGSETLVGDLVL